MKLSNDQKLKIFEILIYTLSIFVVIFYFRTNLLLISLIIGWFTYLIGYHAALHFYSSHHSFEPRNRLIKHFLLLCGTLAGSGSSIMWAATHRLHHQHSDSVKDPHHPILHNFKHNLKLWFHYFPIELINIRVVKDLTNDVDHKFYHKHYYKIHLVYVVLLLLIDPLYVGYFWAIPIVYGYFATNITVVTLHLQNWQKLMLGRKLYYLSENDATYNSNIAAVLVPGAGNHNNHHRYPGAANNDQHATDIDLAFWFIKLIGKNINKVKIT